MESSYKLSILTFLLISVMEGFQGETVANNSLDQASVRNKRNFFESKLVCLLSTAVKQALNQVYRDEASQNDNEKLTQNQLPGKYPIVMFRFFRNEVHANGCENNTLTKVAKDFESKSTGELALRR